ncbi:MAG: helix-turn-helix domain-containing protein [Magnetococcales bacterium]|nr:helix-turn-helix domain-containing protein [Magnetococcales bacterium]
MNPVEFHAMLAQFQRLTPLQRRQAMEMLAGLDAQSAPSDLAEALQQWRKRSGWSQDATAHRLGISRTLLSEIENNRRSPSRKLVQRIRNLLADTTMNIPESDLWASVLEQALADLSDRSHRRKALLWFSSRDDAPGSFLFVCDALNLDPDKVLAFARQRKMATFAVNAASSASRVVFKPPQPQVEFDLTAMQRQEAALLANLPGQLRAWRKEQAFLTQAEVAAMLGIGQSSYSDIERGDKLPSQKLAQRLLELMRTPSA